MRDARHQLERRPGNVKYSSGTAVVESRLEGFSVGVGDGVNPCARTHYPGLQCFRSIPSDCFGSGIVFWLCRKEGLSETAHCE